MVMRKQMTGNGAKATATFSYPKGMLNLEHTFANGQMFRWRQTSEGWWDAVAAGRMLTIRQISHSDQDSDGFEYATYPNGPDEAFAREFLRLDVDLGPLYQSW